MPRTRTGCCRSLSICTQEYTRYSHPARKRLPVANEMQGSSREAHRSRRRRHLDRPDPLTFLKLGRYHRITRRPAAVDGCRHDLVGRLFECTPNIDPDTRPREDGTASRFGTRYRNEQPTTDTDKSEESQGDAPTCASGRSGVEAIGKRLCRRRGDRFLIDGPRRLRDILR